jgi:hypothetical protein
MPGSHLGRGVLRTPRSDGQSRTLYGDRPEGRVSPEGSPSKTGAHSEEVSGG